MSGASETDTVTTSTDHRETTGETTLPLPLQPKHKHPVNIHDPNTAISRLLNPFGYRKLNPSGIEYLTIERE